MVKGEKMKFKKGCVVLNPEKIIESYEIKDGGIYANVENPNTEKLIYNFIKNVSEGFLFLEMPNLDEAQQVNGALYEREVYYLDGLSKLEMQEIFNRYKNVLLEDGLIAFGFGSHNSYEQISVDKYNVVTIVSEDLYAVEKFLEQMGIKKVEKLVTAWDIFDKDNCGKSSLVTINKKTIYHVKNELEEIGLYKGEQ